MSAKKTLILAVILIAAVFYMAKVEAPQIEEAKSKGILFPKITTAEVERIDIAKKTPGEVVTLVNTKPSAPPPDVSATDEKTPPNDEKENAALDAWQIEGLVGAPIDRGAISALISTIRELKLDGALSGDQADKNLATYGLAEPNIKVKIKSLGKAEQEIFIGSGNDYLMKHYAKLSNDNSIYLIPDAIYTTLSKGKADYRDKVPVKLMDNEVSTATIKSSAGKVKVIQTQPGTWKIQEPTQLDAGSATVSDVISALRELRAQEFVDADDSKKKEVGLATPDSGLLRRD